MSFTSKIICMSKLSPSVLLLLQYQDEGLEQDTVFCICDPRHRQRNVVCCFCLYFIFQPVNKNLNLHTPFIISLQHEVYGLGKSVGIDRNVPAVNYLIVDFDANVHCFVPAVYGIDCSSDWERHS